MTPRLYAGLAEPTIRFCEANVGALVQQPANSYSSLIISLAGVWILWRRAHRYSLWLGLASVLVGIASFGYHASFTFIGQLADLGSLFLIGSYIAGAALRTLSSGKMVALLVFGTGIPLALTAILKTIAGFNIGVPFFALILIGAIALELRATASEKRSASYFWAGVAVLAAGYALWILDFTRVWCDPQAFHLLNGHSVWHAASALALLLLDRHYRFLKRAD